MHTQDVMNYNRIIFPNALLSFLVLDPSVVVTGGALGFYKAMQKHPHNIWYSWCSEPPIHHTSQDVTGIMA